MSWLGGAQAGQVADKLDLTSGFGEIQGSDGAAKRDLFGESISSAEGELINALFGQAPHAQFAVGDGGDSPFGFPWR